MHTITLCSFKGGTAKTSTALHLGACLAKKHNKKVLLVDFDAQANLSVGVGVGADCTETIAEVLQGKITAKDAIKRTSISNLDLVPSNTFLDGIESTAPLVSDLYAHERLRKALSGLKYDFCFIDTPPSLGWLTQSAFFAAEKSIICAVPEPYSILALNRLKEYHMAINENHALSVMGVVMTFWDERGATNQAYLKAIEAAFPGKAFQSKVRRDIAVSRAILLGEPVFETAASSRAALDYESLTLEFLKAQENSNSSKKTNNIIGVSNV